MTGRSSASEGDKHGRTADNGAQLAMQEVTVDGTLQSGPLPQALSCEAHACPCASHCRLVQMHPELGALRCKGVVWA